MGKAETVVDFAMKFTHFVSDLRNLGEVMEEKEVVQRFLRATPAKFDALTLSLEQYGELDKVSLDESLDRLPFTSCGSRNGKPVKKSRSFWLTR